MLKLSYKILIKKNYNKSYCFFFLENEKNQEIFTSKSLTLDTFTKAHTLFDDADYIVANEDEQKLEAFDVIVRWFIEILALLCFRITFKNHEGLTNLIKL